MSETIHILADQPELFSCACSMKLVQINGAVWEIEPSSNSFILFIGR